MQIYFFTLRKHSIILYLELTLGLKQLLFSSKYYELVMDIHNQITSMIIEKVPNTQ